MGKQPDHLLVNVFYNPGDEGAKFDYGYRGAPSVIELEFDASASPHRFAIEWGHGTIRWLVDGQLIHERVNGRANSPDGSATAGSRRPPW